MISYHADKPHASIYGFLSRSIAGNGARRVRALEGAIQIVQG